MNSFYILNTGDHQLKKLGHFSETEQAIFRGTALHRGRASASPPAVPGSNLTTGKTEPESFNENSKIRSVSALLVKWELKMAFSKNNEKNHMRLTALATIDLF